MTRSRLSLLIVFGALLVPAAAAAQDGYMFHPPRATVSFRLGAAAPGANGDLYDFFTRELTLDRDDFRAFSIGADAAVHATPRLAFVFGLGFDMSHARSEFRDWVDQDDLPIEQTTSLARIPITASARLYLAEPGRRLSRHAWVPASFTPYVMAGGGWMAYQLEQEGDFVDHETLDIFNTVLESNGGGPMLHVGGGAEWWFAPHFALNVDGRYQWASASVDRDFSGVSSDIDLRGLQVTAGLAVRF
jgi:hypothetical protein